MLDKKIRNREPGIITYGLTPPKRTHTQDKLVEISQKQIERIRSLDIDSLVIYDIQDESDRNEETRPFPYISTVDSVHYSNFYLKDIDLPKIIYRCVGKYSIDELSQWINEEPEKTKYTVFVGAPSSSNQHHQLSLKDAYHIMQGQSHLFLGGVAIPERHISKKDEHLRIISKMANHCSFFITQVTYNLEAAKDFLSDYYYYCSDHQIAMVPILFTLTPCGSLQTLQFMKWLGISIPKWLENDLIHSHDILNKSVALSVNIFKDLYEFSVEKGIPIGCNIESLSTRIQEIDASSRIVREVKNIVTERI